ncbi:MAG: 50S ribosomal protein L31e [Candidatus Thermoplasmatota archaeon]|nr:50S ribosomal protein L31e [Candidatus Thermoplasmatota archaeon]
MPEEKIYTIPLIKVKSLPRPRRVNRAVKEIKRFLAKHMKSEEVMMDVSLNEKLWSRGRGNIPTRLRVKGVKGDDGVVWAYTPEAEVAERKKKVEEAEEGKTEEQPEEELREEAKEEEAPVEEVAEEEMPEEVKEEIVEEKIEEKPVGESKEKAEETVEAKEEVEKEADE